MPASSKPFSPPPFAAESLRCQARASDVEAVARLVAATGVFSPAEIGIARELVEEHLAKGAEASGYHVLFADGACGLDGYACFGPIPGTVNRWELYWIAVHPKARGKGLGSLLQQGSERRIREKEGVLLIAETSTRPDYAPARRFYVAQGYVLLAEIADWHDEGDGLAIFGKRLDR